MTRRVSRGPNNSVKVYRSFDSRKPVSTASRQAPRKEPVSLPSLPGSRVKRVIGLVLLLILLKMSYISKVVVEGLPTNDTQITGTVTQATKRYVQARPWRHFQMFISSQDLAQELQKEVPNLSAVRIKRSLLSSRVTVSILPRRPSVIWQQGRGGGRREGHGKRQGGERRRLYRRELRGKGGKTGEAHPSPFTLPPSLAIAWHSCDRPAKQLPRA